MQSLSANSTQENKRIRSLCFCVAVTAALVAVFHFAVVAGLIEKQRGVLTYIGTSGNIRSYLSWLGRFTPLLPVMAFVAYGVACFRGGRLSGLIAIIIIVAVIFGMITYTLQAVAFFTNAPGE